MYNYGILALELYIPKLFISQTDFEQVKKISKGKITLGLGQLEMSFVSHLEDVNSMALSVLRKLLERTKIDEQQIGKLEFATETLHDKSKSSKTILMKLFKNKNIEGVTNLNACYGGTAAIFNCLSWGQTEGQGKYSIVVMSDVAWYDDIAALPTSGSGAVAVLMGPNANLIIERNRFSHFDDQYDFYKPNLQKESPVVNGKLSMKLYQKILIKCFDGLKKIYEQNGQKFEFFNNDFFCFHVPFYKQVEKAFLELLFKELQGSEYNNEQFQKFYDQNPNYKLKETQIKFKQLSQNILKQFLKPGLEINQRVGNIYTGSLMLSLISLICSKDQESLKGKRVCMYSYGSGVATTLFTLRFKSEFQKQNLIDEFSIQEQLNLRRQCSIKEFDDLAVKRSNRYNANDFMNNKEKNLLWDFSYFLSRVDKNGKRLYLYNKENKQIPLDKVMINVQSDLHSSKFRDLTLAQRREIISQQTKISLIDVENILRNGGLTDDKANLMVENCIGSIKIPLGLAKNFIINNKSYSIPMATEEPSVIAAASYGAKLICQNSEGFKAVGIRNVIRGQIFYKDIQVKYPSEKLKQQEKYLIKYANLYLCPSMSKRGGGLLSLFLNKDISSDYYIVYALVDVQDAMGANTVNTILEGLQGKIAHLLQATHLMSIMSNLTPERVVKAWFEIPVDILQTKTQSGLEIAKKIIQANEIAKKNIFRATTHNKGIMNGISALGLALGQDTRAIEASCHAFSAYKYNHYRSLTNYQLFNKDTKLRGEIEIPFTVGAKGGVTQSSPSYRLNFEILGNPTSKQIGIFMASLGLAQNFSALKALVSDGIQKGHMKLHARNMALSVGVPVNLVNQAVQFMQARNSLTVETALEFLKTKEAKKVKDLNINQFILQNQFFVHLRIFYLKKVQFYQLNQHQDQKMYQIQNLYQQLHSMNILNNQIIL